MPAHSHSNQVASALSTLERLKPEILEEGKTDFAGGFVGAVLQRAEATIDAFGKLPLFQTVQVSMDLGVVPHASAVDTIVLRGLDLASTFTPRDAAFWIETCFAWQVNPKHSTLYSSHHPLNTKH